jgi:hypothetical protein
MSENLFRDRRIERLRQALAGYEKQRESLGAEIGGLADYLVGCVGDGQVFSIHELRPVRAKLAEVEFAILHIQGALNRERENEPPSEEAKGTPPAD